MNVFLTGGSGFIGRHIAGRLAAEHNLTCFVRSTTSKKRIADLTSFGCTCTSSLQDIASADAVINAAGKLGSSRTTKEEYEQANIAFTRQVLSHCSDQLFIQISSAGIHGPGTQISEQAAPKPTNRYERSKLAGERIVQSYHNHIILRPGFVLGPGDVHLKPFFRSILQGKFRKIGSGENLLQPLYVGDLAEIIALLLAKKNKKHIINSAFLVAGPTCSFDDFYFEICRALDAPYHERGLPVWLMQAIAKLHIAPHLVTRSRIAMMTESRTYNTRKLQTVFPLEMTPLQVLLAKTLRRRVAKR